MVVVTTAAGGERAGCLVGFSCQCSIDPPRYAVWISAANHTHRVAMQATHVAVHFLRARDLPVAELFGGETGDTLDKFAAVPWHEGAGGVPLLDEVPDRFAGLVIDRVPGGDHTCFVLQPVAVDVGPDDGWEPLPLSVAATRIDPGHPA